MSMKSSLASSVLRDSERFRRGFWGMRFGEEIQFQREERGLSVEDAAKRAGLSAADWQAVEDGLAPDSWEQVCAVGKGLGEKRVVMASLVIRYGGAWEDDHGLLRQIRRIYS